MNPDHKRMFCRFCGKECFKAGALKIHEDSCHSNPNRVHKIIKRASSPRPSKIGGHPCRFCGENYRTKKLLYEHLHLKHNIKSRQRKPCEYCGEFYSNKRKHYKGCIKRQEVSKQNREIAKEKISVARKKWLAENPEKHPWKFMDKYKSKPCETLKKVLRDFGFSFEQEFTDKEWGRHFSLDIAFLDKKIGIEVNGNQHYNRDGSLTDYYQERHDLIEGTGWLLLEVPYMWCYKPEKIELLKMAIDKREQIDLSEHKRLFKEKSGE